MNLNYTGSDNGWESLVQGEVGASFRKSGECIRWPWLITYKGLSLADESLAICINFDICYVHLVGFRWYLN